MNKITKYLSEVIYGMNGNGFVITDEELIDDELNMMELAKYEKLKKVVFDENKQLRNIAKFLWNKLGDVPSNDDGEIENPFLHFPSGTECEEVWHWFEETFELSVVVDLMGDTSSIREDK